MHDVQVPEGDWLCPDCTPVVEKSEENSSDSGECSEEEQVIYIFLCTCMCHCMHVLLLREFVFNACPYFSLRARICHYTYGTRCFSKWIV